MTQVIVMSLNTLPIVCVTGYVEMAQYSALSRCGGELSVHIITRHDT